MATISQRRRWPYGTALQQPQHLAIDSTRLQCSAVQCNAQQRERERKSLVECFYIDS